MEEAMEDYRSTLRPEASSYGRTILVDGEYIGDVWCYCMNREKSPGAMLGFCIFNESCWSKGIATQAVMMFLNEVRKKCRIQAWHPAIFPGSCSSTIHHRYTLHPP
ncbi:MAG: GNAT family N-acetyltransferase, partial [Clostridiales bacterium]|nr:GNAT family N-acetyltransferase [Clostridiales bacterium]